MIPRVGAVVPASPVWPRALLVVGGVVVVAASLTLMAQTAQYLTFDPRFAFLRERPEVTANRVWRTCFYLHVAGGIACLATGPLLLWNGLAGGRPALHRAAGRVHAVAALGWVGPTGLYLAAFAKGGVAGQLGFMLLGLWFVVTSMLGICAIRRGDVRSHVVWMVRSYALILSALSFRAIHRLLHDVGLDANTNYVASTWASLVLAILTGELLGQHFARFRSGPAIAQAATP